jgi:hypothetical protein
MSDTPAPQGETLGTYQMVWDCRFCGTASLPALSHRFCPNCGAAQDARARRFPADSEKIVVENYTHHGADWVCAACTTPNRADARFCQQCGAPAEAGTAAQRREDEVRREGEAFSASAVRAVETVAHEQDVRAAAPAKAGTPPLVWLAVGAVAIAVLIGLVALLTARRDASALVTGHSWERSIAIEQLSAVSDGTWCDLMPGDAYQVSRSERQRSSRSVPDGEDCRIRRVDNGDGTFSERRECTTRYREEPIYDQYCTYTVNRWVYARSIAQEGESLRDAPRWPLLQINSGMCLGCEREGGREEAYVLRLQSGDQVYTCRVDEALWQRAQLESAWNFTVSVVTGQPDCDSLQPAG